MSFVPIAPKCNEPLEAAHVSVDDVRYDMAECGAAGPPVKSSNWSFQLVHLIGPIRACQHLHIEQYRIYRSHGPLLESNYT